ncbi:MAG TPA: DUF5302 domain-containing protein [Amycolatopsis sp.]|nr:DUF5302 domain-containing protein [Amycolatopsis sp.]
MSDNTSSAGAPQESDEPEDDVKRRFREALERKQAKARSRATTQAGGGTGGHTHGPAAGKRAFRRKSG